MTTEDIARYTIARAALVRVIREGQPPNGVQPADCGLWAPLIDAIYTAHADGGTQGARDAYAAAAASDRNVAALLAEDAPAVEAWESPLPLSDTRALPTFPVDALPGWLAAFVAAEAEASQVPVDLPGMLALSVLATACQGRVKVRITPGWGEPVNVFTIVSLPPANRKSSVFTSLTAPLAAFERDEAERLAPEIARATSDRKVLEGQLAKAQSIAATPKKDEDATAAMEDARRLAVELDAHIIPARPRLIADDVTPEKLASMLAEQGGRMAVMSPEGGVFDIISGRYSQGAPNIECFLKGHAGDTLRVDRGSRPSEYVQAPALTVGLCVQPEVLNGLVQRQSFRGRGLLGRFLYSVPESLLGRRNVDALPVPARVRAAYDQRITALLSITHATDPEGHPTAHTLSLSPGAAARNRDFAEALEPRLGPWGDLSSLADWAGKLVGAVVRIAGLLHLAADGPGGLTRQVDAATLGAATRIGAYLEAHAIAAFGQMGADEGMTAAQHVLRWIERNGADTFTKSTIYAALKGTYKSTDALNAPLNVLVEHGYIRRQPPPAERKAGRPPEVYEVNPTVLQPSFYSNNSINPATPAEDGGLWDKKNKKNEDTPPEDTPEVPVTQADEVPVSVATDPYHEPAAVADEVPVSYAQKMADRMAALKAERIV